ncbi:hypothetical protein SRABI118_00267 [Massilia sp. Bi118]|uniref:hypothetical protein n=1 Tax=Massilia sp. Bi118 TaxID=2822346 RepID=UPI001DDE1CD1|nr:hypothetical protein [Massilia sp. Bi118]CAH0140286.1 hypothetical protein SRABI118_00267 [Massilia sp. Bi118]
MAYRWETPASVWLEDESSGQFELAASEGLGRIDWSSHARGRVADFAHLLGASLPRACADNQGEGCEHSPIYPEGFSFCPVCGKPLTRLAGMAQRQPDWWGPHADQLLPRHVPHGLPVTSLPLGDSLEERPAAPVVGRFDSAMPPPPNSQCIFIAAGYGFPEQRLLALAPGRGVLQYWDPLGELWHVLVPEEGSADLRFGASDYGWLPAAEPRRGEVGLVPTAQGLYRLWINPINETYRLEPVLAAPMAAAPGAMRRQLACLVRGHAGVLVLSSLGADLAPGPQYECGALPLSGWSRPIGYDGQLCWLHDEGQLLWRPGEAPRFLPWPDTWLPRLQFGGPTLSRDGRMWLIGHDGLSYCFLELGVEKPQREPIDGARLGFANLLFRRGHPVVDEPWSGEHVEDQNEDDSLVLPLLRSFNNNRAQPSGLVLRFHKYTGRAEEALADRVIARTTVEWIGRRNVILDEIARLSRPLECLPFVYANHLWLHHPDWNRIRGWNLEELT